MILILENSKSKSESDQEIPNCLMHKNMMLEIQRDVGAQKMELQTLLGNKIFKMGFREQARVSQTHKAVGRLSRENHKGLKERQDDMSKNVKSLVCLEGKVTTGIAEYQLEPDYKDTLAWRIPWTEEPGGLLSMGLHRVGHD